MAEDKEKWIPPVARDWEDAATNEEYWQNRTVESHPCIDCLTIKEKNNSYSIRAKLSGIEKCWLHLTVDEKESYLYWLLKLKTIEHSIRGFNLYMIKTPILYDLSNCDLQAVNFEKAKLKKINMMLSNLEGANLSKTLLKRAYLSRTILKSASLVRSILVSGELDNSDLTFADCDSAVFDDANLQNSNFTNSNLKNASIKGRILSGVIFKSSNLSWSKAQGVFFERVDFSNANLWHAFFENTNIWFCNLKNANFNQTLLNGAKIIASEAQDAKFIGTQLKGATLGSSNFESANFQKANISGAKFENSNFNCAHLYNAVNTLKNDDDFGFCDMSKLKIIGEEKDKQYNFAAEVYMQIKNNLKQNGRYHFAEKIFYKEMVCRRKGDKRDAEEEWKKSKCKDEKGKCQGSKFLAFV